MQNVPSDNEVYALDRLSVWFAVSAGAILAITGIAKVWSALGNSKMLSVVDPIIGIKFGHLMPLRWFAFSANGKLWHLGWWLGSAPTL
jgi:hypothetical protein